MKPVSSSPKLRWMLLLAGWTTAIVILTGFHGRSPADQTPQLEALYQQLFTHGAYAEAVARLKEAYTGPDFPAEVQAAGRAIAKQATLGLPLLDSLGRDERLLAKSIEAELLMHTARGTELRPWDEKKQAGELDVVQTDQIAARALPLLSHDDPYVRGMAEFALSIRVGLENAGSLQEFPGRNPPAWYATWLAVLTPENLIELDYVRHSALLGLHRSTPALRAEVERLMARMDRTQAYLASRGVSVQPDMRQLAKAVAAFQKTRELPELRKAYLKVRRQAREVVMRNPDMDFEQLVFAQHHAFHDFGNITNGGKSYVIKPGGDLYLKDGFHPAGKLRGLVSATLGPGHTRGFELHYDADRIVFSFAPQPRYYEGVFYESDQGFDDKAHGLSETNNLYETDLQGQIRQLTQDPLHVDIEPTYLPNGDIVFSSDRGDFGSQCCGNFFQNKHIVNQYRMAPDGSQVRPMSNNVHFDRYNHVLDDGQLIYTRWEYQERHLWRTHNLWTSRPDGAMADAIYKQHINDLAPMALRDARQIYGTDKLIAIGCGHHEWEQGAVMVIDPHMGINDPNGMLTVTPHISPREGGIGAGVIPEGGGVIDPGGLYQQPFALSENAFLAAYSFNLPRAYTHGFNFGLYYLDVFGNKELIHRDPVLSAWYPTPLKKRPLPKVIPDYRNPEKDYAEVYVTNIAEGVPDVQPGEIRYIRIAHHTEWPAEPLSEAPHDYNHLHYTPSGSWSRTLGMSTWSPARVIGTVPVEADGSAFFKVPADVPVYFQALDENLLEVRRMRTFVTLQAGEVRGCTGCHETRDEAPQALATVPMALRQESVYPKPPSWGSTTLPDYETHIHPLIVRNCQPCHGENQPAGGLEFSSRRVDGYYQAYRTMFGLSAEVPTPVQELAAFELNQGQGHNMVVDQQALRQMERNEYPGQLIFISNKFSDNSVTQVRQFGSGRSPLIQAIRDERHRAALTLTDQEWEDLVTWVDLNAPYWGTFINKEPVRTGEKPIRVHVQIGKLFGLESTD